MLMEKSPVSHGVLCWLCFSQRVKELEKENTMLKSEKEELNQRILQQSQSSEGKS